MEQPDKPKPDHERSWKKTIEDISPWLKFAGWAITTAIASYALWLSIGGQSAEEAAKTLANQQSQQIIELQKTTPMGEITRMTLYGHTGNKSVVANLRNDPMLRQRIYSVTGTASDVPDNGNLFMVVHEYVTPTSAFNFTQYPYFITGVTLYGKSTEDQNWEAGEVYIGKQSAPNAQVSYRLTLYFCNSVDSAKIIAATQSNAAQAYGVSSLPYPSCKQLDSIFIIRGSK